MILLYIFKVNTKNNDSYKVNRQSNPSITSQLQKIPKQDFDEKVIKC